MKRIIFIIPIVFLSFFTEVYAQQWGLYTLYATKNGIKAYLIDTADTPVSFHTWTFSSSQKTVYSTYLLPGDTLLRNYKPSGNTWDTGPVHGGIQKIAYDGTIVWDWQYYQNGSYCPHHDMTPMPNGNVLLICYEAKSAAEATQAGYSSAVQIYSEKIIEVKPTGLNTGTIVWEWHLWDHLCQNYNSANGNYVTSIVDNPQLLNINYAGTGTPPDKFHMNGIDYNPVLDQIVVSMHFMNSAFVIDHSTTTAEAASHTGGNSGKGGDFLYRWGNPASYEATGATIFNVVHDAHWVPADNPNYPNYLCGFNNNSGAGNSKVDIWNPPYSGNSYSLTQGQAYTPASYNYEFTSAFTSNNEGNSQQLPNGNMLVNNSFGNIYEVSATGTQLWTKTGANSSHAYRFTKCQVRGAIATASGTPASTSSGTPVYLNSSAISVTETDPTYTYSWSSIPSGFTSALQNPTVIPTEPTTYIVTITNTTLGCSDTASVTIDYITGISENNEITNASIFPNPFTNELVIEMQGNNETVNFEIFNSIGQTLSKGRFVEKTVLQVDDFLPGIYFIKLDDGKIYEYKKIIKK